MKKLLKYEIMLLAALLVIALVVRLASCGAGDPTEVPPTTEAPQVTTTAPAPQITWKTFPETRQLTARQAFVYDCQTQEFGLLAGAPTDRVYAASITLLDLGNGRAGANQVQHISCGDGLLRSQVLQRHIGGEQLGDAGGIDPVCGRTCQEAEFLGLAIVYKSLPGS